MLIWIAVAFITVIYVLYLYAIKDVRSVDKMFPGPFALPLLGNAWQALGDSAGMYRKMITFSAYYGQSFRVWFAHKPYLVITEPHDAEAVLGSQLPIDKAEEYEMTASWIGYGLLISGGDRWRKHRKLLTPAFHFKILDQFIDVFQANSKILCEKLAAQGNNVFDVYELVKLFALDNICETAMGTKLNAQNYPQSAYVQAIRSACLTLFFRALRIWYRSDTLFNMSPAGAEMRECLRVLHGTTNDVIKSRKKELKTSRSQPSVPPDDEICAKKKLAFIDILLRAAEENNLSDEDIRAEVDTFMFEGHDTITSGISFALFNLAEHPDIQEKVFKEQKLIFGDDNRSPSHRDLQEMKYLEQVIKESLRLYPSVPVIGRKLQEDFMLREDVVVPKGVQILVLIAAVHRDSRTWNNPHEFNPDNFSPEAVQKRHPYAFLPFSAGPRNCIGQRFAVLEMKSALSHITRKFELLPSSESEDKPIVRTELILNSKNGIKIKVKPRAMSTE